MKIEDFEFETATEPHDDWSGVELVCPDADCPKPFFDAGKSLGEAIEAARRHIDDHHHQPIHEPYVDGGRYR